MSQQFEELWTQFLEGELDDRGLELLQQLLSDDEELSGRAARLYEEHRLLGYLLQPFDDDQFCADTVSRIKAADQQFVGGVISELHRSRAKFTPELSRPQVSSDDRSRHVTGMLIIMVTVLFAAAGILGLSGTGDNHEVEPRPLMHAFDAPANAEVVTLLLEEECVWSTRGPFTEGQRLGTGRIELESGTAVLRFDGGAELVMVGAVVLDLQSADRVLVHVGDVVVRATDGAEGFVVTTPTSEVVDLGTEFAIKVDRRGTTEVHVLEGEVSYRKLDAPADLVKILRAGEGVSIDRRGRPVAVPMNSPRFQEYVQRLNPGSRTDLLTAYDGFNYSPGILSLDESTVGIGWAGPWRRRLPTEQTAPVGDESPDHLEIVHGQLNVTWPVPGGRMGMLKLPAQSVYYLRPLKDAIELDRDSVTYFSLMVRETSRPDENRQHRERVRLTFRSLKDYYSGYISFGHGSGYQPRVRTGDGTLHASPNLMPAEQTTLWTGKIVSRAQGEDRIYFRVYGEEDVLGYAEPATWHVVTDDVDLKAHLDCVLLSSEGATCRLIDELRIGPTWRSVAPMQESEP